MQEKDKPEFLKALLFTFTVYNRESKPSIEKVYFETLKPYSLAEVHQAFREHISDPERGSFCPLPADLIRAILRNREKANPSMSVEKAWGLVVDAIRRVGSYGSPNFGSYPIHKAINCIGGWQRLCSSPESDLNWMQKDFEKFFKAYEDENGDLPALRGCSDDAPVFCGRPQDRKAIGSGQSSEKVHPKVLEFVKKAMK